MNTTLTVNDPLADQEVAIVITLAAGEQARDERLAQVSVGVTGQPPVTRIGPFGQVAALINQAWMAFGVQAQVAATQGSAGQETRSAGETTDTAAPGTQETTPQPHTPAPESQPDLSFLF